MGRWLLGLLSVSVAISLAAAPSAVARDDAGAGSPVRHVEPGLDPTALRSARSLADSIAAATAPLAQTFELHSSPGSTRKLFIDFDGGRVGSTAWNADLLGTVTAPPWDPARDGDRFSDRELAAFQEVWQRVSEDYAPWQIDVTTEDPGRAGLNRSGRSDLAYGVRMLVTPATDARSLLCGACGGVSYTGVFDFLESAYNIGWIFPQGLGHNTKYVAEAVSHEAGHTLGLSHDNMGLLSPYYKGQGPWAPIMGAAYSRPITQFSAGYYSGAGNTEDDVAIIGDHLPLVADEAGDDVAHAAPLEIGRGIIATRFDRDVFDLGVCPAGETIRARPAAVGPNLDIGLELLGADGGQVAYADPPARMLNESTADGLGAALVVPARGHYFARIDGVGSGNTRSGYDDYASLGRFRIDAGRCEGPSAEAAGTKLASKTAADVPSRARRGTRPSVKVTVRSVSGRGPATVRGRVRLRVGGETVDAARLKDGRAVLTVPRISGTKRKLRVVVVYLGDRTHEGSRVSYRIRVVRR